MDFRMPNIETKIKIGNFSLSVFAYRKLTKNECIISCRMYLKQKHLKTFPKSGSGKVITHFGSDPELFL